MRKNAEVHRDSLSQRTAAGVAALLMALAAMPAIADWDEGRAAFGAGQFAEAASHFRAVTADHEDYAAGHFMLGQSLSKLGRKDEAAASLARAAELDAANAQYALALAQTRVEAGDADQALTALAGRSTSDFGERNAESYRRILAAAATDAADRRMALKALEAALESSPEAARLWLARGRVLQSSGDPAAAFTAFERADRFGVEGADAARRAISAALAAADGGGEGGRAAWLRRGAEFGEKAGMKHSDGVTLATTGGAWLELGEPARARPVLTRAAALTPGDATISYRLGRCANEEEKPDEALPHLEAALAAKPKPEPELEVRILRAIGYAHRLKEDFAAAADAYRRAGADDKVQEMERLAGIAEENDEFDRLAADCRARKERFAATRADAVGTLGPQDLASLDLEIERKMADCEGYL